MQPGFGIDNHFLPDTEREVTHVLVVTVRQNGILVVGASHILGKETPGKEVVRERCRGNVVIDVIDMMARLNTALARYAFDPGSTPYAAGICNLYGAPGTSGDGPANFHSADVHSAGSAQGCCHQRAVGRLREIVSAECTFQGVGGIEAVDTAGTVEGHDAPSDDGMFEERTRDTVNAPESLGTGSRNGDGSRCLRVRVG